MTMSKVITVIPLIALSVSACTPPQERLKVADYADAGTTALVIAQGGVEMNPVIGVAGNSAAPQHDLSKGDAQ